MRNLKIWLNVPKLSFFLISLDLYKLHFSPCPGDTTDMFKWRSSVYFSFHDWMPEVSFYMYT